MNRSSSRSAARLARLASTPCLVLLAFASLVWPCSEAPAAAPVLEHLFPAGSGPGSSGSITFSGKFDPWPPRIWVEGTGVAFVTETNSGKARVDVSTNALPGPRWIRLFNDEGASEPRLFVVGSLAEIQETETNNAFTAAQSIPQVPATINGRLDKNGDVDSFAVAVRAGQ